eukprot:2425884-Rhodomonas_salina.1
MHPLSWASLACCNEGQQARVGTLPPRCSSENFKLGFEHALETASRKYRRKVPQIPQSLGLDSEKHVPITRLRLGRYSTSERRGTRRINFVRETKLENKMVHENAFFYYRACYSSL